MKKSMKAAANAVKKKGVDRRKSILQAAMTAARTSGYTHITRDQVAELAECASSLVAHHWGTMAQLRRAIMGEAIRTKDLLIIAQGLVEKDPRAMGAPDELKEAARDTLL